MKKRKLPEKYSAAGYANWDIRRTIREAVNVSRWNPWLAHAWMEEARNAISIDNPFFTEYDKGVQTINNYWIMLTRFPWFDEQAFWSIDGEPRELTLLEYSTES